MSRRLSGWAAAFIATWGCSSSAAVFAQRPNDFAISFPIGGGTGYAWQVDESASQNVGPVKVELVDEQEREALAGSAPRQRRLGGPMTQVFKISPTAPSGVVVLKFFGPVKKDPDKVMTFSFSETSGKVATAPAPATSKPESLKQPTAAIPAAYDWSFLAHGGSGELWFGDDDWAEGEKRISLSCLPKSNQVEISAGSAPRVVLSSGGHQQSYNANAPVPLGNLVLAALRKSGRITIAGANELSAKPRGAKEVERFFTYCSSRGN
jgi:hypothetical protein